MERHAKERESKTDNLGDAKEHGETLWGK